MTPVDFHWKWAKPSTLPKIHWDWVKVAGLKTVIFLSYLPLYAFPSSCPTLFCTLSMMWPSSGQITDGSFMCKVCAWTGCSCGYRERALEIIWTALARCKQGELVWKHERITLETRDTSIPKLNHAGKNPVVDKSTSILQPWRLQQQGVRPAERDTEHTLTGSPGRQNLLSQARCTLPRWYNPIGHGRSHRGTQCYNGMGIDMAKGTELQDH